MFDSSWPGWGIVQSAISAAAGILGVFAGTWMTSRRAQREQTDARIREQLELFYSPMLGMHEKILAKNDTSRKMDSIAVMIRDKELKIAKDRAARKETLIAANPMFQKLGTYNAEQWREEILPIYESMLQYFTDHMWLAEPSTRAQYGSLTHFVEVWRRQMKDAIEIEVAFEVDFSDDNLKPLNEDLRLHFDRLTEKMRI